MPKAHFSDLFLRAIKPPESGQLDFWDTSFPGFGCRVSQGGSKTFILNIRNRRRTLGRYGILSLAKAREEARLMDDRGPLLKKGRMGAYRQFSHQLMISRVTSSLLFF